jgi:hypothetical protein
MVRSVSERKRDRERSKGEKADEYRRWDGRGREWLYGFVWFEQRRDGEIKRGYMQVRGDCLVWLSAEIARYPHQPPVPCALYRRARQVGAGLL